MDYLAHWVRGNDGSRQLKEIPERVTVEELEERLNQITVVIPYFQQAAQVVLFSKSNTNTYPKTMAALRGCDDILIENNSYGGLTEGQKATLLITETTIKLGITI